MSYWPYDEYLLRCAIQDRQRKAACNAELERQLREAGVDRRSWSARMARRLLSQVGHVLVAWGQHLQGYDAPRAPHGGPTVLRHISVGR